MSIPAGLGPGDPIAVSLGAADPIAATLGPGPTLYWTDGTPDAPPAIGVQMAATGGNTFDIPGYRVHEFNASAPFTVTTPGFVEYLIVGGAGGGSGGTAGGGGAGGVRENVGGDLLWVPAGVHQFVVGDGGLGNPTFQARGFSGEPSSALGLVALGGGYGGRTANGVEAHPGDDGASGGGGANYSGHVGAPGQGTPGQGHDGGVADPDGGGGGGGAGGPGEGRDGGPGIPCDITGEEVWYAAGGGGAANVGWGLGGRGGGGDGAAGEAEAGEPNTGSGGGAGWFYANGQGKQGGSGKVVVRYALA